LEYGPMPWMAFETGLLGSPNMAGDQFRFTFGPSHWFASPFSIDIRKEKAGVGA